MDMTCTRRYMYRMPLFLILLCGIALPNANANPQVPRGGSNIFVYTGKDVPSTSGWDIKLGAQVIASNISPNGWSFSTSIVFVVNHFATRFTIGAPTTAAVTTNYEVRYNGPQVGGGFVSAFFDVVPSVSTPLSSITVNPPSVLGGATSIGTATLTGPAPGGGALVTLSSSNTAVATVPQTVTIAAGQISATFNVSTLGVSSATNVTITGAYSTIRSTTLTVTAPALVSLTLIPPFVDGGASSTGTVALNGPAPNSGVTVSLSSDSASASVPTSVTITGGTISANFSISSVTVATATTATISAVYAGVTKTAGLAINPPGLISLTLSAASVISGGSVTGTVTMKSAPSSATTVTLRTNSNRATVPPSVQVNQGSTAASFSVNTLTVTAPTPVIVTATNNGWTQSASLTILPIGYTLSVQNLDAYPGNGCTLLSWSDVDDSSIRGYNVYRKLGANVLKVTNTPVPSAVYADTGTTNGTAYQYQVSIVNSQGQEVAFSPWVNSTPVPGAATLNWLNVPPSASGIVSLHATTSAGGIPVATTLLVDGQILGGGGTPAALNQAGVECELDTSHLTDGNHTIQLYGILDTTSICATPPLTLTVANDVASTFNDVFFEQPLGETASLDSNLPAGTLYWTVDIINDADNSIIRTWQGSASTVHLAWDGTNSVGAVVDEGDYSFNLTAFDGQGNQKNKRTPLTMVKNSPNALNLIVYWSSSNVAGQPHVWDDEMALWISAQYKAMRTNNPGLTWQTLRWAVGSPLGKDRATDRAKKLKIRLWMATSVTDFYLFNHGTAPGRGFGPSTAWGGINFFSSANDFITREEDKHKELHFVVPHITGTGGPNPKQYNFAWMDNCCSAGGNTSYPNDVGTVDTTWATAFNIGTNPNFSSAFFGFNGLMANNSNDNGSKSVWLLWRRQVWAGFVMGLEVSQSINRANTFGYGISATILPWDTNREYVQGFTWLP